MHDRGGEGYAPPVRRLLLPALLAAAALPLLPLAPPAVAQSVEQPAVEPGVLLPDRVIPLPGRASLIGLTDEHVVYSHRSIDPDDPGGNDEIRRLSDGQVVRRVPTHDGNGLPRVLSGRAVIERTFLHQQGATRVVMTDIETGELLRQMTTPTGDQVLSVTSTVVVALRRVDDTSARVHLLRPHGTDGAFSDTPTDLVLRTDSVHRVEAAATDERSTVLRQGEALWIVDLASAVSAVVKEPGDFDTPEKVLLAPGRVWWAEVYASEWVDIGWRDRAGTTGERFYLRNPGPGLVAFEDELLLLRQKTYGTYDLVRFDPATGRLGGVLVHSALAARSTPDGRVVVLAADAPPGRLLVLTPGQDAPTVVRELEPVIAVSHKVSLSLGRVAAHAPDQELEEQPVATLDLAEGTWEPGLAGRAAPGALVHLAGQVLRTRVEEEGGRTTDHLTWPGGSRTAGGPLGRGGVFTLAGGAETAEVRDVRSGAVHLSVPRRPDVRHALDGRLLWTWGPGTSLRSRDLAGDLPPRESTVPCAPGYETPLQVVGRWAMVQCLPASGPRTWHVVDLAGLVQTWQLPPTTASFAGDPRLSDGFVVQARQHRMPDGDSGVVAAVVELSPDHRERLYGPLVDLFPPGPSAVPDDDGSPRIAFVGSDYRARLARLDWLAPAPGPSRDTAAPQLVALGGSGRTTPTTTIEMSWRYTDARVPGQWTAGVTDSEVRLRQRDTGAADFGPWQLREELRSLTDGSARVSAPPGSETCWQVRTRDTNGNLSGWSDERCTAVSPDATAAPAAEAGAGSRFVPTSPVRMLDTRAGVGAPKQAVGPGQSVTLQVTGTGGVPAAGVSAVALNVTAVGATARGFVTAYPTGQPRPEASNLNLNPGVVTPNLVIVKVGDGGRVTLYNSSGTTHLLADLAGYYTADSGSSYRPLTPARLLDTREGTGARRGTVGPAETIRLKVTGVGGVPATGVTAVALNLTAVGASGSGFVTAFPGDEQRPEASNLNLARGRATPNLVLVKVGPDGVVALYNHSGTTHLLADVAGYFTSSGSSFTPVRPARLLDTREGLGARPGAVGAAETLRLRVTGLGGVPAGEVTAVVLNVTAVGATATGFVTAYPAGEARPQASNLNLTRGLVTPNLVVVKVGDGGLVDLYNSSGSTHLLADVAGYYAQP